MTINDFQFLAMPLIHIDGLFDLLDKLLINPDVRLNYEDLIKSELR